LAFLDGTRLGASESKPARLPGHKPTGPQKALTDGRYMSHPYRKCLRARISNGYVAAIPLGWAPLSLPQSFVRT